MATRTAEGPLLANRYRVLERLGSGGMAAVYLARDERLGRRVAVKRLHSSGDDDTDARRFEREAKIGASLSHPNLVSIFDTEQDGDSVLLVMEYVDGETLADLLARGPVPAPRAAEIVCGVAEALDYAHGNGIVHRDVKPANVLLGNDGSVKLADLGIAKAAERGDITRTGTVLGTPAYMAPEQLGGDGLGPAVDVYALATMAFEMLTGKKARSGRTAVEIAHQVVNEPPPDPRDLDPEIPGPVARVLRAGMAREPEDRPASAVALAQELRAHVEQREDSTLATQEMDRSAVAASPPPREPARRAATARRRSGSRGPVYAVAALLAVAIAAGAIALGAGGGGEDGSAERSAGSAGNEAKQDKKKQKEEQSAAASEEEPQPASAPDESAEPTPTPAVEGSGHVPEPSGQGTIEEARSLQEQGFAALNEGDYEQAIELSRKSVLAFPPGTEDPQYAYALFNLGKALRLEGRPEEAIPVLEARLQIPNQQGTVQNELDLAREAAGQ